MAVMNTTDRAVVHTELMQDLSGAHSSVSVLKAELRADVDAADQWVSDNAASYNSALPAAFRTSATAAQKAQLLSYVLKKRFEVGA